MRRRHFIALAGIAGATGLTGCVRVGRSRLNPFNWFGRGEEIAAVTPEGAVVDPRPLVPQVIRLEVESNAEGAIIRVAGLPPRQGWYDAALVRVPTAEPDVLSYQLRAQPASDATLASTPPSREIVVAAFVSDQRLRGIREIRVSGALNALAARR